MTISEHVLAPKAGRTGVLAVSTTASAAIDAGKLEGALYFTFLCDVEFYIVFADKSDATSLPAPVVATTGTTLDGSVVDGRCYGPIPAKTEWHRELAAESRYFRVILASGTGTLRYQPSSPRS